MSATGRARRGKQDPATAPLFGEVQPPKARKKSTAAVTAAAAPAKDVGFNFYPTPPEAILPLLESSLLTLPGGVWIEPCAGTGRIVSTVNEFRDDVRWIVVEKDPRLFDHLRRVIRPGLDVLIEDDFFASTWAHQRADVLMMNSDFDFTMDFVRAGFERARWIASLQRAGWCGTKGRSRWLRQHCPDVYRLLERPSFTPDGGTDATEYDWHVWPDGGHDRHEGRFAILDVARGGQLDLLASPTT